MLGAVGDFMHTVLWLLSNLEFILAAIALFVLLLSFVAYRMNRLVVTFPFFMPVVVAAFCVLAVVTVWKGGEFIYNGVTARARVEELREVIKDKDDRIEVLEQTANRKEKQTNLVVRVDGTAQASHDDRMEVIVQSVQSTDLSLANQLALSLTRGFYTEGRLDTDAKTDPK